MEIDISCGLPAVVDIHCDGKIIPQRIDFQGVPFRCSCCRSTGHLRKNCPSLRRSSPSSGSSAHFEEPVSPLTTPASDKVRRASFLPISACDNVMMLVLYLMTHIAPRLHTWIPLRWEVRLKRLLTRALPLCVLVSGLMWTRARTGTLILRGHVGPHTYT